MKLMRPRQGADSPEGPSNKRPEQEREPPELEPPPIHHVDPSDVEPTWTSAGSPTRGTTNYLGVIWPIFYFLCFLEAILLCSALYMFVQPATPVRSAVVTFHGMFRGEAKKLTCPQQDINATEVAIALVSHSSPMLRQSINLLNLVVSWAQRGAASLPYVLIRLGDGFPKELIMYLPLDPL